MRQHKKAAKSLEKQLACKSCGNSRTFLAIQNFPRPILFKSLSSILHPDPHGNHAVSYVFCNKDLDEDNSALTTKCRWVSHDT